MSTQPTTTPAAAEKAAPSAAQQALTLEQEIAAKQAELRALRASSPAADEMVKVKATVAKVGDFHGFWSGGVFFPNGTSVQMVPASRVSEIRADEALGHRIAVAAVGDEVKEEPKPKKAMATMPQSPPPGAPSGAEGDSLPGAPGSPGKKLK